MKCFSAVSAEKLQKLISGITVYNDNGDTSKRINNEWISTELGKIWEIVNTEEPPYVVYLGWSVEESTMQPYHAYMSMYNILRWSDDIDPVYVELDIPEDKFLYKNNKYGYVDSAYVDGITPEYLMAAYSTVYTKETDTHDTSVIYLKPNETLTMLFQTIKSPRIGGISVLEFYEFGGHRGCDMNLTLKENACSFNNEFRKSFAEKIYPKDSSRELRQAIWEEIKDKKYGELRL